MKPSIFPLTVTWTAAWLLSVPGAAAQPPFSARTQPPALEHRSTFERYRRFDDQPPSSWREANDTVGRIGGWRAYGREAQQADPPEARDGPVRQSGGGAAPSNPQSPPSPGPADGSNGRQGGAR
jgi:hypothetical protein